MAKRVYEEENIRAVANKLRELTQTDTQYTTYDLVRGVEECYEAGYTAGYTAAGTGGSPEKDKEQDKAIHELREAIAQFEDNYTPRLLSQDTNLVYVERSKNRGPIGYKLSQAALAYGVPERDASGNINVPLTPAANSSAVAKQYVDGLVGDVENALDSIISMQESLIGGGA